MITSEQVRAARALLRMEQRDLAQASGVSLPSIKRLEGQPGGLAAQVRTVDAIRAALEAAGVIFVDENGEGAGVRLRKQEGTTSRAHPKPEGPATEVVEAMDAAIEEHRRKTKKS